MLLAAAIAWSIIDRSMSKTATDAKVAKGYVVEASVVLEYSRDLAEAVLTAPATKASPPFALEPSLVRLPPVRRDVRRLLALKKSPYVGRHFRDGRCEAFCF
jgi:hypothetical protein